MSAPLLQDPPPAPAQDRAPRLRRLALLGVLLLPAGAVAFGTRGEFLGETPALVAEHLGVQV